MAARAGFTVVMRDVGEEFLARGLKAIDQSLQRDVAKERLSEDEKRALIDRIKTTTDTADLRDAFIVVEAATEDLATKTAIFKSLDETTGPDAILASNTSSISITKLGAVTQRPDRVIGMHFMNPVPVMKLVEIIRGAATSDGTYEAVEKLTERLGKIPLECQDSPGFVSNRVLMPMINEAIFALYEGVASRESIDGIMKLGMNHPMGPLTLADFIGLDTLGSICDVMFEEFRERRFAQPPTLRKMLAAGWCGRKSGMGFYDYSGESPAENPGL